jgi:hypothetical protein
MVPLLPTILLVLLAVATPSSGTEVVPAGPEFKISTRGFNYSYSFDGYARTPRVASAPNGDFVVVWESYFDGPGGSGTDVFGRRFDRTGAPRGPDFGIANVDNYLSHPNVGVDAAGGFVVTWNDYGISSFGRV